MKTLYELLFLLLALLKMWLRRMLFLWLRLPTGVSRAASSYLSSSLRFSAVNAMHSYITAIPLHTRNLKRELWHYVRCKWSERKLNPPPPPDRLLYTPAC